MTTSNRVTVPGVSGISDCCLYFAGSRGTNDVVTANQGLRECSFMPFTSYANDAAVARVHHLQFHSASFVMPVPASLSRAFLDELTFTLTEVPYTNSEASACETLIYPILREVWKPFHQALTIWSHQPLHFDDDLSGIPDYVISRRSPLGAFVPDLPYMLVVEAKRDDFERGWGQCLAAMLAAQKMNRMPDQVLYGVVTNGRAWEFGKLDGAVFTRDPQTFSLHDMEKLAGALAFALTRCREQAERLPRVPLPA